MATDIADDRAALVVQDNKPADVAEDDGFEDEESRQSWSGRVTFWLAAVGSAVGLGNLWRFPWQCATWGGGAFIFAYFVCLFTLGMPILTQELALGQKHRSGDIEAFGRMNWRLRGIGLASVIGTFGIVTFYMAIIGVSLVFFFESFRTPLPYGADIASESDFLYTDVLMLADSIQDSTAIISGKLYLATSFCWIITFCCIMKGVKSASWAVKITMPLPLLLLFIMLIKGLTLPGAWEGIKQYWDFSNWSLLGESGIWNAAIGQCFFSLSVCMGVMTAYGSYNPRKQDVATDEKVIAFLDVGTSLLSGFVVYSVLGYVVHESGDPSKFDEGGLGLVFAIFPVAISEFAGSNFFGIVFYLTLVLLGIDSAFSMVEAISTVIADSDLNLYRLKWSRTKISGLLCVFGAVCSSLYCFDTGLFWLDIVDRYINNYGMVFIGICESGACGWYYKYSLIESKIGGVSANLYRVGYWFALLMACFLGFALATPEMGADGKYVFTGTLGNGSWIVAFCVGLFIWLVTIIVAYHKRSEYARKNLSFLTTLWYIMGWENVEVLRDFINENGLGDEAWKNAKHTWRGELYASWHHGSIGIWWGFLIKYWLPTVLMVNLVGTMREERWNPYGGYPWGCLTLGILIFSSMILVVFIVAVYPQWMTQKVDATGKYNNLDPNPVAVNVSGDDGIVFGVVQMGGDDDTDKDGADGPAIAETTSAEKTETEKTTKIQIELVEDKVVEEEKKEEADKEEAPPTYEEDENVADETAEKTEKTDKSEAVEDEDANDKIDGTAKDDFHD